jgi:hypothetical protein
MLLVCFLVFCMECVCSNVSLKKEMNFSVVSSFIRIIESISV